MGVLSLTFLESVLGYPLGGMIGEDLIKQLVAEIDYGAGRINLFAPAVYKYSGPGDVLPVQVRNGEAFVSAELTPQGRKAVAGRFLISTSAEGALVVNAPFARRHRLLESVSQAQRGNTGEVSGNMTGSFAARVENIRLGRYTINNPVVSFSQATGGEKARVDYDGILGGEVCRRFKLILDYSRRRIIVEPNAHLAEPVEQDMSGFELIAEGEDFKTLIINEVVPDSPASEAGLQDEDQLMAIDGRPVSEFSLDQIRQMLKQQGKEYTMRFKRGEQTLEVKIKLRRLI